MDKNYRDYLLYVGIISLVMGILLFTYPATNMSVVILVIGLTWFIQGLLSLVAIFSDMQDWGWKLFGGVISIAAGLLFISQPMTGTVAIPPIVLIILGVFGLMIGISALIAAFRGKGWEAGFIGLISIVLVLPLLFNSLIREAVLVWVAALLLILQGSFGIGMSFRRKKE